VHVIVPLMAFAYLAKAEGSTPTFTFSEERSIDGSPKINVRFQNGESDTLILSTSERDRELMRSTGIEECRYFGHLENEPEACVAMTGCPGSEDVEFTILSKNIQESPAFLWTKDGSVELINLTNKHVDYEYSFHNLRNDTEYPFYPDEVYTDETTDFPETPDFHQEMRANPPPAMQLGIRIGYGDVFKQKVGNPEKYIRDGMAHTQAYYCHSSFGSLIDLHYPIIEHISGYHFRTRSSDKTENTQDHVEWKDLSNRMRTLTKDTLGDMDLRLYVGYDDRENDRVAGRGSLGVVCEQWDEHKWSVNEYAKRVSDFGETVAHELGHNLGLNHDFEQEDKSCNCQGIMSYAGQYGCPHNLPPKWSTCSKADFNKQYNKVVDSGKWCMAALETAPSCSMSKLCNQETFNDGICDDFNNNERCSFDGGDCCDYKLGWDSRCKENNGDCECKEKCKDGKGDVNYYGDLTEWCHGKISGSGGWCDRSCGSVMCSDQCKRGCMKCDEETCQDVGTILGNYGNDFCSHVVNNGLCDKTDDACGKETCGDLCKKSCNKCKPDPLKLCQPDTFNDGICDDFNNNERCSFDGGDCCDYKPGWDSRCKANNRCWCQEPCKDNNAGWCFENIVKPGYCPYNCGGITCSDQCKRGCKTCDAGTCQDLGTIFGNKGSDFCSQIKNNGLCDKTDDACGKESCGDLCKKTCGKCP